MGGCLKTGRAISVQTYHSDDVEDRCVCGKPFASPDARFCCHCGASREGHLPVQPQRKYSVTSNTSRQSSRSKFSNIMPGTVPSASRTTRRSGTGGSATSSVSSRTTVDEASEDQTSDERHVGDRPASRHHSGVSRSTKDSISVASDRTGESSPKKTAGMRSPQSGSPRCTKPPKEPRATSLTSLEAHQDMAAALSKALKHSGSLVTSSVQMRALQAPDGLGDAFNFKPRPDTQMPPFEAKVDQDNLLAMLPQGSLKANQLSLQRVTFMSTEWLGLRLAQGTHAQCISFCLCVIALQNIGKNTSRSVVVETSNDEAVQIGFACAPIIGQKKSKCSTAFLDHAEDIGELAQIFLNDDGNQKKVTADLKKWCQKAQRKFVGSDLPSDEKSKTFSLRGLFASIEESLGALGSEGNPNKIQGGGRRNSNGSINGEPSSRRNSNASLVEDRRKSLPPGLETPTIVRKFTPEGKPAPKSKSTVRSRSSSSDRHASKSKRSHASYDSHDAESFDSSSRHASPQISERRRRNSDPGLPSMMGLSDEETVVAMKMKRKKSFDAAIMPTLNEDDDSESKEAALSPIAPGRVLTTAEATQPEEITSIAIAISPCDGLVK